MVEAIEALKAEVKTELLKKDKSTLLNDFKYIFKKITGNTYEGVSYSMNGSKFDARKYINNINTINRFKSFQKRGNTKTSIPSVHITFIQDASGSYCNNVEATRNIYNALQYACDNDLYFLNFDIVTINSRGIKLLNKNDEYYFNAQDGGVIPDNILNIIKSFNFKKADINLMIGLFDGKFFRDKKQNEVATYYYNKPSADGSGFAIFNNNNSIVISDIENEKKIKKYAPKCDINIVDENNYPTHLYNNILKALTRVIKQCSK